MNILDIVGISLPCRSCGNNYQVPLRDVLLSHALLHHGCTVSQETECPPVFQSRLFDRKDIEELQRAWNQLEQRAEADGGELVLMATDPSSEANTSVCKQIVTSTVGLRQASFPVTRESRPRPGSTGKQSEATRARIQKQGHSKTKTRKNRKIA